MSKRRKLTPQQWEQLSDEELLQIRVCDLGIEIHGTPLQERVEHLYAELESREIGFRPPTYLADEWLCPDRIPVIGVAFFLAHPRLTHLERRIMLEAEGGTDTWCMKLLRHESGHAINYAYRLYARTRWRELFGRFSARYTKDYYAQPYSRRYVNHLEDNYAQAHPDEDFAETFAVWLNPHSRWEHVYKGWPAMKKLQYVDRLMRDIGPKAPVNTDHHTPWSAARMRSTLAAYYERKRKLLGDDFPGYFDPALKHVFVDHPPVGVQKPQTAAKFLRRHKRRIVASVSAWTHQRKFDIDKLMRKLALRCEEMNWYVHRPELETAVEVTALVASIMSNVRRIEGGPRRR